MKTNTPFYPEFSNDWDETKDREYAEVVMGTTNVLKIVEGITKNQRDLHNLLSHGVAFFNPTITPDLVMMLPIPVKVRLLRAYTCEGHCAEGYKDRFRTCLEECVRADHYASLTLARFVTSPLNLWLKELIVASDLVASAHFELDMALRCEHDPHFIYEETECVEEE